MWPTEFRDVLQAMLALDLGYYQYADGSTSPAIRLFSTGESYQPGTTVHGLECSIERIPEVEGLLVYSKRGGVRFTYSVWLAQWDRDWSNLPDVMAAIVSNWPGTAGGPVPLSEQSGPQSVVRLLVPMRGFVGQRPIVLQGSGSGEVNLVVQGAASAVAMGSSNDD